MPINRQQEHDESKLPKWALEQLAAQRRENHELRTEMEYTKRAKAVLESCNWCPTEGPWESPEQRPEAVMEEVRRLWILYPDHPFPVCELKRGDEGNPRRMVRYTVFRECVECRADQADWAVGGACRGEQNSN